MDDRNRSYGDKYSNKSSVKKDSRDKIISKIGVDWSSSRGVSAPTLSGEYLNDNLNDNYNLYSWDKNVSLAFLAVPTWKCWYIFFHLHSKSNYATHAN
jgi:hypothetical protein